MQSQEPQAVVVSRHLQRIARVIEEELEVSGAAGVAFSLFVFSEGRANYISNSSDRATIKQVLLGIVDGWDNGMPDIPAHEVQ